MSTKGIYTAVSGAMAQNMKLDTIANNMANANTPAFKRDGQLFREYLSAYEKLPDVIQVPKIPASIESFYDVQSGDQSYVESIGSFTDFSQGSLKATGNPLDLGLDGKGFFEVLSPQGIKLTRHGSFMLDSDGRLVTRQGHPVLATTIAGQTPDARIIRVIGDGKTVVTPKGEIFLGEQRVAQLSIVDVNNPDALRKVGDSNYIIKENMNAQLIANPESNIKQGYLEASNVNLVKEMTDLISTTRTFESAQKAIQAYDQMNDKLINTIPRF